MFIADLIIMMAIVICPQYRAYCESALDVLFIIIIFWYIAIYFYVKMLPDKACEHESLLSEYDIMCLKSLKRLLDKEKIAYQEPNVLNAIIDELNDIGITNRVIKVPPPKMYGRAFLEA